MEFKSLQDIIRIVENALAIQFYGQSSVLRKSVLKVLARVVGGALYMLVLIAKRIWKNRFVSTCDVSALDGFGAEYGIPHKVPLAASGNVLFALENGVSSVEISQGTVLIDSTSSLEYEVSATVVVTSERGGVPVKAIELGPAYNLTAGTVLELRDGSIEGIVSITSVDVDGGVLEAVEIDGEIFLWGETAEEYRSRLLNRIQNPPHGGALNDYWQWAMRFPFVTNTFVYQNIPETNSVSVVVANYNASSLILTDDQLDEVAAYITDDVRRPITADVKVFNATPVAVAITASVSPYNESIRNSVKDALTRFLKNIAPGRIVAADELELNVLANSTAKTFSITNMKKAGEDVQSLDFTLSYPENDDPVAQVAKLDADSINLQNGEA